MSHFPQECFSIESDMAMGTRKGREWQEEIWYHSEVAEAPGHPFYRKLEAKLKEAGFDRFCEEGCKRYYADPRAGHHWFWGVFPVDADRLL